MAITDFQNIRPKESSDKNDVEILMNELKTLIPQFPVSTVFKRDIFEDSDEDHYTETLIKYFVNENPKSRFSYKPQASLPDRRSIDIGVHLTASSEYYLFNIEAKFLPPKDYVTGEYGAIKRFKKCQHGLNHRNPEKSKTLPESAIIGYSKSGTSESHLEKVNKKIERLANKGKTDKFGLTWAISEKLKQEGNSSKALYKSEHRRIDNSTILLHHFWVNVIESTKNSE